MNHPQSGSISVLRPSVELTVFGYIGDCQQIVTGQSVRLLWVQLVTQHLGVHADACGYINQILLVGKCPASVVEVRVFCNFVIKHGSDPLKFE